MRVLVTGGGGFLGRHICERLRKRGDQVRILTRKDYPDLAADGIECMRGDVRNEEQVDAACQDQDAVIHTAAVPGIWGPWRHFYSINTLGTERVVSSCLKLGITKLVHTSSPSVVFDGRPHVHADESLPYPPEHSFLCNYPRSKMLAERTVLAANSPRLATIALRPHLIWGPGDNHLLPRLISRARQGKLRRVGNGQNVVSMAYVENVAEAHLDALDALQPTSPCAGNAYFINEPDAIRLWDWVNQILERADLSPLKRSVSTTSAYRLGCLCEIVYRGLRLQSEPPMTRFLAQQLSQSHSYSIERAKQDFGYSPQICTDEGMRRVEPELRKWAGAVTE